MFSFNNLGRYGKLGNQMFQYAALLSAAEHYDVDYVTAPLSHTGIYKCFNLNAVGDGFSDDVQQIFREMDFAYSDSLFKSIDPRFNTDIIGYFQSEKYFFDIRDLIRREFTFRDEVVESVEGVNIDPKDKVAIHIRRADYLGLSDTHPVQPKSYYLSAMEEFPDSEFLIFSDDIDWCRRSDMFFGEEKKGYFFSNGDTNQDLYLMSQCRGHIIANSSFSWWGAWLANSGKVIAPKQWFGPKGPKNWQDVYCEGWRVI